MRTAAPLAAATVAALALFGSAACLAQTSGATQDYGREAVGQSTSMPVVSTMSSADAYKAALTAGHANGQEATGQSTAAPMVQSTVTPDQAHDLAVHAGHATGQEAPGQSTSMPMASHS